MSRQRTCELRADVVTVPEDISDDNTNAPSGYSIPTQQSSGASSTVDDASKQAVNTFNDLSELLEYHHFGIVSNARSFPSKAVNAINIPEVSNINIEFIYNFFEPNERKNIIPKYSKNVVFNPSNYGDIDSAEYIKNWSKKNLNDNLIFYQGNKTLKKNINDYNQIWRECSL